MKRFKDFFKLRKKKFKNKVDNTNLETRNNTNYINQPPYGMEGRTITPTSN